MFHSFLGLFGNKFSKGHTDTGTITIIAILIKLSVIFADLNIRTLDNFASIVVTSHPKKREKILSEYNFSNKTTNKNKAKKESIFLLCSIKIKLLTMLNLVDDGCKFCDSFFSDAKSKR